MWTAATSTSVGPCLSPPRSYSCWWSPHPDLLGQALGAPQCDPTGSFHGQQLSSTAGTAVFMEIGVTDPFTKHNLDSPVTLNLL